MAYDRADFLSTVSKKAQERQQGSLGVARIVQGAAVVMVHLTTQDPHWNRFLSYLQGFVDQFEAAKARAQGKIGDPQVWGDQLLKLKTDIIEAECSIRILKAIMELPKAIIEGGEQAREIIAKFEKQNDQPTDNTQS